MPPSLPPSLGHSDLMSVNTERGEVGRKGGRGGQFPPPTVRATQRREVKCLMDNGGEAVAQRRGGQGWRRRCLPVKQWTNRR